MGEAEVTIDIIFQPCSLKLLLIAQSHNNAVFFLSNKGIGVII